jgi:hypothetical protein
MGLQHSGGPSRCRAHCRDHAEAEAGSGVLVSTCNMGEPSYGGRSFDGPTKPASAGEPRADAHVERRQTQLSRRASLADAIGDKVTHGPVGYALVIDRTDRWGSGKTLCLRWLRRQPASGTRPRIVHFNPCLFRVARNSCRDLIRNFGPSCGPRDRSGRRRSANRGWRPAGHLRRSARAARVGTDLRLMVHPDTLHPRRTRSAAAR